MMMLLLKSTIHVLALISFSHCAVLITELPQDRVVTCSNNRNGGPENAIYPADGKWTKYECSREQNPIGPGFRDSAGGSNPNRFEWNQRSAKCPSGSVLEWRMLDLELSGSLHGCNSHPIKCPQFCQRALYVILAAPGNEYLRMPFCGSKTLTTASSTEPPNTSQQSNMANPYVAFGRFGESLAIYFGNYVNGSVIQETEKVSMEWRCILTTCGNGIIDMGEDCDDGNSDDGDECPTNCRLPVCEFSYEEINLEKVGGNITCDNTTCQVVHGGVISIEPTVCAFQGQNWPFEVNTSTSNSSHAYQYRVQSIDNAVLTYKCLNGILSSTSNATGFPITDVKSIVCSGCNLDLPYGWRHMYINEPGEPPFQCKNWNYPLRLCKFRGSYTIGPGWSLNRFPAFRGSSQVMANLSTYGTFGPRSCYDFNPHLNTNYYATNFYALNNNGFVLTCLSNFEMQASFEGSGKLRDENNTIRAHSSNVTLQGFTQITTIGLYDKCSTDHVI